MANAEHLEILRSGVEKWNEWRAENIKVIPDLSGVNLAGIDFASDLFGPNFSGIYFSGANLSRVNLKEINLSFSILTGINLSGASLLFSNLLNANLSGANLLGANLSGSNLSKANLSGATLSLANLTGANLSETILHGAILANTVLGYTDLSTCQGLSSVQISSPCVIDFSTLKASKNLPKEFLTKLGLPNLLIEYLPDFYNPALMLYPAFLSHSWKDKTFVRKLYEALTKEGVTVWLDEKKMKPSDDFHDSISEGIKYYDILILVCSENSLNSWWVEKELERVYEKEREMQKERGKKFRLVIPIRIDDHVLNWKEGILTTVRNSVIGDFTKWQDETEFNKAVKELVAALKTNRVDVRPPSFL